MLKAFSIVSPNSTFCNNVDHNLVLLNLNIFVKKLQYSFCHYEATTCSVLPCIAIHLFSNRSQVTSKRGKKGGVASEVIGQCVIACEQAHGGAQRTRGVAASVKSSGKATRDNFLGTFSPDSFLRSRFPLRHLCV